VPHDGPDRVWRVRKAESFAGEAVAPPDKSISHRAVLLGALTDGSMRIDRFLVAEDTLASVRFASAVGANVRVSWGEDPVDEETHRMAPPVEASAVVQGVGLAGLREPKKTIDCGNSGTTMRLGAGIAAGIDGATVLTGDDSLRSRPMRRIVEPLSQMGARITGIEDGDLRAPLEIQGGRLHGIESDLSVASAQVKSAILLAGLFASGRTVVREPGPSRDHTERMLGYLGVEVERGDRMAAVMGGQQPVARDVRIVGDISSAAYLLAAAAIVPGGEVTVRGVGLNPTRTGFLEILEAFGADVQVREEGDVAGEPAGRVTVRQRPLEAARVSGTLVVRAIDELPLVAVIATQAKGSTVVTDAAELRVKETDRISTICRALAAMGARIEPTSDGFVVQGPTRLRGATLGSEGDHRIAMALAVAGLAADGEAFISGAEAADVSFPGFAGAVAALSDGAISEAPC
jgi:3-phosphoshikimate 1-carboxyvinyltransferase